MANERLQKWALIAEVAGGLAIIISLVFVGIQFRENTRATRSAMATDANTMSSTWYMTIGSDSNTSGLLYRFLTDFDSLAQEEKFQMVMYFHAVMLAFQNSFYLANEGTLDPGIRDTIVESVVVIKDTPGWHYFWENRRPLFLPEFQVFIDELMKDDREISQSLYQSVN